MDNSTTNQLVQTTIEGNLLGYNVTTTYSNAINEAPQLINIYCNIVEETARININISCTRDEIWNISANMVGNKSMIEIIQLVSAIKDEVLNTIVSTAITE